jgi:leucyl-tRNA synthetase
MYNHRTIEQKWIQRWTEGFVDYTADNSSDKESTYILVEFPFPSGAGLHAGHVRSYVAQDIKARMYRMQGQNVLYPMGWDAFGLPTENYAIQNNVAPAIATANNIANYKKQLALLGLSFDWSREINTTDPQYYRWTQWIWLQMYKAGLAYQDTTKVWWCEELKTVLANEEVIDGKSERGGHPCERVSLTQWMLAITKYADRLDKDLDTVDYLPVIKTQQRNWIGRSEGVQLKFQILDSDASVEVFTTRIDTLFGVTFLVLAPEHPILDNIVIAEYKEAIQTYQKQTKSKSDLDRQQEKEKTGVFTGAYAIHPITGENIPIWTADYVLMGYGTGAIMAVPAHDERDREFAEKYNLAIINVITEDNILENSDSYNGLSTLEAKQKLIQELEFKNLGHQKIQYKLRDWVFSRQRYWGEPFPIVWISEQSYGQISGEIVKFLPANPVTRQKNNNTEYAAPLALTELPLELPEVESYIPQGLGEGPLAQTKDWVEIWYHIETGKTISRAETKPDDKWVEGVRETDTMPNWAGSSWYYLRYADPHNTQELASKAALEQWLPVDLYNGGMEQVTVHLLYSRFWHKFLYDIGVVPTVEPYQTRIKHGIVLAEGGVKMSKSKGNTVDPVEMVESFGADALRIYEMFMGPYDEAIAWDTRGLIGCSRFLKRVYQWVIDMQTQTLEKAVDTIKLDYDTHSLIRKITEDIENQKYNTCISSLMEYLNTYINKDIGIEYIKIYIALLSPFAPHITEELWEILGETESVHKSIWPQYDESKLIQAKIDYQIHINGKMRDIITVDAQLDNEAIQQKALESDKVKQIIIDNNSIKKIIINQDKRIVIIIY